MCPLHCSLYFKMVSPGAVNENPWEEGRRCCLGQTHVQNIAKPKRNDCVIYSCINVCM